MTSATDAVLTDAPRLVLATRGATPDGPPLLTPMAHWWDGANLWMTTSGSTAKAERIAADDGVTALATAPDGEGPAVVVRGRARVYSLRDPVGAVVHGPVVSAAMAALAVKNSTSLVGYAQDLARLPLRWWPQQRVAVRVAVTAVDEVPLPAEGPGIAPALPADVPAGIRRAVAGVRRVVVGFQDADAVRLVPALWSAGWHLDLGGAEVPVGRPLAVVADADPRRRPSDVAGVCVTGRLVAGAVLRPARVRWWEGFAGGAADVPEQRRSAFVLPD